MYSRNAFDSENPFTIVNKFLKENPKLVENPKLAKDLITVEFLSSVLSRHVKDFNITKEEFAILLKIKPTRIELPIKDKNELVGLVGKSKRGKDFGIPGTYIFTNKSNGFSYVGSSISLVDRLFRCYFGSNLGDRKIDLALKESGLNSFYLDIYILPRRIASPLVKRKID